MIDAIYKQVEDSIAVKQAIQRDNRLLGQIAELADSCLESLLSGGKIIFCGNGGSFADAQHLSAEFISRFLFDRAPLPSLALGTNSSSITAIGNDYGYEQVFARELQAIAQPKDVFIAISTSGNSPNVIEAVEVARQLNLATVALSGNSGGQLKEYCECICIPSCETARIQECHIMIGHILCGLVELNFFKKENSGK